MKYILIILFASLLINCKHSEQRIERFSISKSQRSVVGYDSLEIIFWETGKDTTVNLYYPHDGVAKAGITTGGKSPKWTNFSYTLDTFFIYSGDLHVIHIKYNDELFVPAKEKKNKVSSYRNPNIWSRAHMTILPEDSNFLRRYDSSCSHPVDYIIFYDSIKKKYDTALTK